MCYNSDANRARFEGAGALERLRALQRESLPEETREAVQAAIRLMQLKGGAGAGGGTSGGTAGETARGGKRAAWQARCIRRLRGACCVQ